MNAAQGIICHNNAWFVFSIKIRGEESGIILKSKDIPILHSTVFNFQKEAFYLKETLHISVHPAMGQEHVLPLKLCYKPDGKNIHLRITGTSLTFKVKMA